MQDRRKNVRVRPTAECGIDIDFGTSVVKVRLAVLDIAVGGVGLMLSEELVGMRAGSEIRLRVTLPDVPRFETLGTIRYTQGRFGGRCGVHFGQLTEDQQSAMSRIVSELLEQGSSA